MIRLSASLLISLLAVAAPASSQTGVLDQTSPLNLNGMPLASGTGNPWQQQVVVGVAGVLEGVTLRVASSVPGDTATVNLYAGAGPHQPGSVPLYSSQVVAVSSTPTDDFVDMSAAGLVVSVGDRFCVEILADSQAMTIVFNSAFFQALYPEPAFSAQPGGQYTSVGIERIGFESWVLVGPTLTATGSCPGPLTLAASDMTPAGTVAFGGSLGTGTSLVPRGSCLGTSLDLLQPVLLALVTADGAGAASIVASVPPAVACGTVTLQAIDLATCTTTNTVGV